MAYRAKTSFHVAAQKGEKSGRFVGYGMILADSDPLVKKHPTMFENVDDYVVRVEQATAAPGEKRNAPTPERLIDAGPGKSPAEDSAKKGFNPFKKAPAESGEKE